MPSYYVNCNATNSNLQSNQALKLSNKRYKDCKAKIFTKLSFAPLCHEEDYLYMWMNKEHHEIGVMR